MREYRKYSKEECLSYLEEYLSSSFNQSQFKREKVLKGQQFGVGFVSLDLKINQVPL